MSENTAHPTWNVPTWKVLRAVAIERARQEQLKASGRFKSTCADTDMSDAEALAVPTEEVGEVARALLELRRLANDVHGKHLREELIQVAAVAVAWAEKLDKGAA